MVGTSKWLDVLLLCHTLSRTGDKYLDMILGKVDMIVKKRREIQHDPGIFLSV